MQRRLNKLKSLLKRGDTIIEVTFAISVFSLVSVISINIMDRDLASIQGTLELEMARNEIDAQAEALRYIQNSYLSERELATSKTNSTETVREFMKLWLKLSRGTVATGGEAGTGLANLPSKISKFTSMDCKQYYSGSGEYHKIFTDNAFVINTRNLDPNSINTTIIQSKSNGTERKDIFTETALYPRVIFSKGSDPSSTTAAATISEIYPDVSTNPSYSIQSKKVYDRVVKAEGIWVIATRQCKNPTNCQNDVPEFYDFHIRACWNAPGHNRPSTIATTIRLYNPEYIEDQK